MSNKIPKKKKKKKENKSIITELTEAMPMDSTFFVTLDVERRDDFGDGLEFGGILLRLFTGQVLLSLLQDEDLEHTLLLLGKLELAHG